MSRTPLLLSLFFYIIYRALTYFTGYKWLSLLVFAIPISLLIINLLLRRNLRFKAWFLNSINIFLEKKTFEMKSEISEDLLFDKLLEVISESDFQLLDKEEDTMNILCGTSTNFWTWGENIYIHITEKKDGGSSIQLISTTLFGRTSWSRNDQNYKSFIASFEAALTI